ncbi:MAG: MFS transporter [Proteobacteria bacterium]|nr:MFS transporter [Pseudomonadota bacterium]
MTNGRTASPIDPRTRVGRASSRAIIAWSLFDWANSGFPTVIITFVFAGYFMHFVAPSGTAGFSDWGIAIAASGLVIALTSPLLGAIGDRVGRVKPWLFGASLVCVAASALLWYAHPTPDDALWALAFVAIANLGFEVGIVFYNALLPTLVPRSRLGRLSGWAWGLGYGGGLTCLAIVLLVFVEAEPPPLGLDPAEAEQFRIAGPVVAAWFVVFALPLFLFTPDRPATGASLGLATREGVSVLLRTLRRVLKEYRNIARFLLARLFYIDGLNTMFMFGGIYATGTFGMGIAEMIYFGIALNIAAGLGAAGFGWVDDWIGPKRTILLALGGLIVLGIPLLLVPSKTLFWIVAVPLGLFMGPAQAASRSLMARLSPTKMTGEMFGLFALSGKITAFLGPSLVAAITVATESQRAGMAVIIVLIAVGGVILLRVREPKRLKDEPS